MIVAKIKPPITGVVKSTESDAIVAAKLALAADVALGAFAKDETAVVYVNDWEVHLSRQEASWATESTRELTVDKRG